MELGSGYVLNGTGTHSFVICLYDDLRLCYDKSECHGQCNCRSDVLCSHQWRSYQAL